MDAEQEGKQVGHLYITQKRKGKWKGRKRRERKREGKRKGKRKGKGKKRKIHCNTQKGTKKHQVMMKPGLPRQHLVPTWIPCTNPIIYHCSEHSSATTAKGRWAQWFWRSSLNPHALWVSKLLRDLRTATQQTISVSITNIPLSRSGGQADILSCQLVTSKTFSNHPERVSWATCMGF